MMSNNELYFENVSEIGNLYLDYVFLKFGYEPIFFTCQDDEKQLYICLCSEIRGEQRWVISKCTLNTLQLLVDGVIDMVTAICESSSLVQVFRDLNGKEISKVIKMTEIDPLELPEEGVLLKCNMMNAVNYITNKKFEILSRTMEKYCFDRKSKAVYKNTFSEPTSQVISCNYLEDYQVFAKTETGSSRYYSEDKNYTQSCMDENLLKAS